MSTSTFTVAKTSIQPKLSICNQICSKKDPIDVYTHTKIEIKAGIMFINTLSSSLFYSSSITLNTATSDCVFAIKTDIFTACIDLIDTQDLEFAYDEAKGTLLVKGTKAKHTLRTNPNIVNDFVSPVEKPEKLLASVELLSKDFIQATKTSFVSVGDPKNTYQPEFCNICYSINQETNFFAVVSTDRFRITKIVPDFTKIESNKENPNYKEGNTNYLLPPKSLKLVLSSLSDDSSVNICFEDDFAWIKSGSTVMTLNYGAGTYPDYNRIIPESFSCSFVINPKELVSALKQVSLVGNLDEVNRKVRLMIQPSANQIKLMSDSSNGESSESTISLTNYEGMSDDWEQPFNSGYLTDYLNTTTTEEILWESNPGKPSILSPKGEKATQMYLVSGLKN